MKKPTEILKSFDSGFELLEKQVIEGTECFSFKMPEQVKAIINKQQERFSLRISKYYDLLLFVQPF